MDVPTPPAAVFVDTVFQVDTLEPWSRVTRFVKFGINSDLFMDELKFNGFVV
jgi:hypothetical protein